MDKKKEKVLGFDVDLITFNDAVDTLISRIKKHQGTHVITINPEIIETAKKSLELKEIINNSQLVVADGTGIKLALKLKGIKQERIPGVDLAYDLLKKIQNEHFSVALIGSKQLVIEKVEEKLKKEFPNINICFIHNGFFDNKAEPEIIKSISILKPNIVLVALGSPKQDFFIKNCKEYHQTGTYIGVGGSFDVWAGVVDRAPMLYRKLGCEWIYRTLKQSQRLKRIYKTLPLFAIKAIIEAIKYRCFQKGENNDK